ncbi:MAG: alpha/beta hydrolase [Bacteroidota bacterium]
MKNKRYWTGLLLFGVTLFSIKAQEKVRYKQVDTVQLFLEIHRPEHKVSSEKYPAMIFFFGGGWKGGDRHHFLNHAQYFSKRGLVCFLADYRTENKHGTTPFESLKDAKSAMRYIRKHAAELGIDPNKIIASGGSAGGHLAAATALINPYNETTDDTSISCRPRALVLFNPVIDNGPRGYGHERIGAAYKDFSPLHNIKEGAPPTILFLGTRDKLIPVATAQYYQKVMQEVGSTCTLKLYQEAGHGFFNYGNFDHYQSTVLEADAFLRSLGLLKPGPKVKIQ